MADWFNSLFSNKLFDFFSNSLDKAGKAYASSALAAQQEARDYTAMREDTAVQRRVEDLKAAGLNPYLALTNGSLQAGASSAATAGTSQAEGSIASAGIAIEAMNAMTSAIKAIMQGANGLAGNILKAAK